jgi:small-conductance mechanosensitive channel
MSEDPTLEAPPLFPAEQLREKLAALRARYALAARQQQALLEQQRQIAEQQRQVEEAMAPILGAIMALEELAGE